MDDAMSESYPRLCLCPMLSRPCATIRACALAHPVQPDAAQHITHCEAFRAQPMRRRADLDCARQCGPGRPPGLTYEL